MRRWGVVVLALVAAACGKPSAPEGPIDGNAGMMISNETVMSDALGSEAANAAAPVGTGNEAR